MYIVFIQEIWVQIYGYFWVQSLCLLGACLWLGWVQSMRKLGAKYMDTFGCMSMPFGCMSMDRLGACMRLLGAKYTVVGCKSMDTFGCMSMPFGCMSMARLGACMRLLGACLTVGSFA